LGIEEVPSEQDIGLRPADRGILTPDLEHGMRCRAADDGDAEVVDAGRDRIGARESRHQQSASRARAARGLLLFRHSEAQAPDGTARWRSRPDAVERPRPRDAVVDDPGIHTKNRRAHRVPLTATAVDIIRGQLQDELPVSVFSDAGSARDRAKKAPSIVGRALDIEDFRGHDLRRTAATRMGEAGVPRQHIAYVLNHVGRDAARNPRLRPVRARCGKASRTRDVGPHADRDPGEEAGRHRGAVYERRAEVRRTAFTASPRQTAFRLSPKQRADLVDALEPHELTLSLLHAIEDRLYVYWETTARQKRAEDHRRLEEASPARRTARAGTPRAAPNRPQGCGGRDPQGHRRGHGRRRRPQQFARAPSIGVGANRGQTTATKQTSPVEQRPQLARPFRC
jgi:hypothetical protein